MIRTAPYILLSFLLLTSCGLFNTQQEPTAVSTQIVADKLDEQAFIVEVISDLKAKKLNALEERYPSVFLARAITAPKSAEMSDDEIRFQILDPLKERFEAAWNTLMEDLKKSGIDPNSLSYSSHTVEYSDDPAKQPNAISIMVTGRKDGVETSHELAFSFLEYNGKWYVFELLRVFGVFDQQ